MVSLLGTGNEEAKTVLAALGWRAVAVRDAPAVWRKTRQKRSRHQPQAGRPDSPFAGLADLIATK
jgi:hypothetical protein